MKTAGGQTVIATPVPKTAEDSARPVTCPHCGNRFLNQNGLVSHIRMSTLTCNTESVAAQKRAAAAMQDLFSGHAGQTAGIGTIRNCCEQTEPVDGSFGSEHSGVTRRYIPECSPARRAVACAGRGAVNPATATRLGRLSHRAGRRWPLSTGAPWPP